MEAEEHQKTLNDILSKTGTPVDKVDITADVYGIYSLPDAWTKQVCQLR